MGENYTVEYAFAMLDPNGAYIQYGLTVRDYFAIEALKTFNHSLSSNEHDRQSAKRAYQMADAMMEERKK